MSEDLGKLRDAIDLIDREVLDEIYDVKYETLF